MVGQILPNNNEKCYSNFSPPTFSSKHTLSRFVSCHPIYCGQLWQRWRAHEEAMASNLSFRLRQISMAPPAPLHVSSFRQIFMANLLLFSLFLCFFLFAFVHFVSIGCMSMNTRKKSNLYNIICCVKRNILHADEYANNIYKYNMLCQSVIV
jgi:hypothetical protein